MSYNYGMIKKLLNKFKSKYLVVYKKQDGEIKSYEITRPKLNDSIANKQEGRNNVALELFALKEIKCVAFVMIE